MQQVSNVKYYILQVMAPRLIGWLIWLAGMSLGMVMQLPEEADETSVSRSQLLAKLDVCMGGRVAEELIFGEQDVTTGASSDLDQACFQIFTHPLARHEM